MTGRNSQNQTTQNQSLLSEEDPQPYEIINKDGKAKCLVICDHSGIKVPKKLDNLGLTEDSFKEHFAQDIGSRSISMQLSQTLDAPCILANFSRLVIDLNRRVDHPTAFVASTEKGPVPGNTAMSDEQRRQRIEEIYIPYHNAVEGLVKSFTEKGVIPAVISIHTFTPVFYKQSRPWEIGLLWVQDPRLPVPIMDYFKNKGFTVGDNEPYDARILRGTTINRHADANGLPNALFEIRNDLVSDEQGCKKWAGLISDCMAGILEEGSVHRVYDGPQFIHDPEMDMKYFEELIQRAKEGEQNG
jgi:predicted N-formylglutamate amidohydrolase